MAVYQVGDLIPSIDPSAFIFESANVMGEVYIHKNVNIWSNASIRGDNAPVTIMEDTNVQENAVLHVDDGFPLFIGPNVTVGHQAMVHGCTIHEGSLIGMQAIVLNGAVVGKNCLIGAGAIVTEGKVIPDNSLVIGVSKVVRTLSPEEIEAMHANTASYVKRGQHYKQVLKRLS